MADNKHTVRKMSVDLNVNEQNPFEVRSNLLDLIGDLNNEITEIMDSIVTTDETIRIQKLELDMGELEWSAFKDVFLSELRSSLQEKVAKIKADSKFSSQGESNEDEKDNHLLESKEFLKSGGRRKVEAILFYLWSGTLPWWSPLEGGEELERELEMLLVNPEENRSDAVALKRLLEKNKVARLRLVSLYNWKWIEKFIHEWTDHNMNQIKADIEVIQSLLEGVREHHPLGFEQYKRAMVVDLMIRESSYSMDDLFISYVEQFLPSRNWEALIIECLSKYYQREFKVVESSKLEIWLSEKLYPTGKNQRVVRELMKLGGDNKSREESGKRNSGDVKEEGDRDDAFELETIELNYAGVIILWPLLKTLYENRKLMVGKEFSDEASQIKALQLLNYLVAGNLDIHEHEMALNKILCGLHPSDNVFPLPKLSEEDKGEVIALLEHMVLTWPVLKNTTPNGLREGFIVRKGHLEMKGGYWSLKVDQKSIDVIMSSIPWGYGMIKLAWMPKMLQVEW